MGPPRMILLLSALALLSKVNGMKTSFTISSSSPSSSTTTSHSENRITSSPSFSHSEHGFTSLPYRYSGFKSSSTPSSISIAYEGCGSTYKSTCGTIKYPKKRPIYAYNENCIWKIETILPKITFLKMDLAVDVYVDFLIIRDGDSMSSPVIGNYTGYNLPSPVQASSNALLIQFISDGFTNYGGFELQWQSSIFFGAVCLENSIDFSTCAELVCRNNTWIPTGSFNKDCYTCSLNNDPHFVTYENVVYDWHGQCNYSLTQEGRGYEPRFALYSQFDLCVSGVYGAACLGDMVYKDSRKLAVNFGISQSEDFAGKSIFNVIVNGVIHEIPVDPKSGTLIGDSAIEEYVLAWRKNNCLVILGCNGIMFQYCGWRIDIWAHSSLRKKMYGLCGTIADTEDGVGLEGRKGVQYNRPVRPWPNNGVDKKFASSWETHDQNDQCFLSNNRMSRQLQESACNANDTELEQYRSLCNGSINTDLPSDQLRILIDDCAFDRCVLLEAISNNPTGDFPDPEEWLNQTVQVAEREAIILENTVDLSERCEGSEGLRGKCFGDQTELASYTKCDSLIKNAPGCIEGRTCCVECSLLNDSCNDKWNGSIAVNNPCPRCDRKMGEIRPGSGCACCQRCKRTDECKEAKGRCISKADPKWNTTWCESKRDFQIKEDWCVGDGCFCCTWTRGGKSFDDEDFDDY